MPDKADNTIKYLLRELTYERIQLAFPGNTLHKGLRYYNQKRVSNLTFHGEIELTAQVRGRIKYHVKLKVLNDKIQNQCTCPIGGECKHVVAVLFYYIHKSEFVHEQEYVSDSADIKKVECYLQSLPKEELIQLVIKFAPENFMELITFTDLGKEEAIKLFNKVATQINSLFSDEDLLYDPESFEGCLVNLFQKLKGIWGKLPDETCDLIIKTLEDLNDLMDQGYLYEDYNDKGLDGNLFSELVRDFIHSLPFKQKMSFIDRLETIILEMPFGTCEGILQDVGELFSEKDKSVVKTYFLKAIKKGQLKYAKEFYMLLSGDLTPEEKEAILQLTYLESDYLTFELITTYKNKNNLDGAIHVIENYLQETAPYRSIAEKLYIDLLRLKKEKGHPLKTTAIEALRDHASIPLLELAIAYLEDSKTELEAILMERDAKTYMEYLKKQKRIREALDFVSGSRTLDDDSKYHFFVRYMHEFPKESEAFFEEQINLALPYTDNNFYYAIANSLVNLKKINLMKAKGIAQQIRTEHKRRRNLIEAIKDI